MLDPFTAIGLAGNIVEFINFSGRIVLGTRELYKSNTGSTQGIANLEEVTVDLQRVTRSIVPLPEPVSEDERRLSELAVSCQETSQDLLKILEDLKIPKDRPRSLLKAFLHALKISSKKGDIEKVEERLQKLQVQLNTRLLAVLNGSQSRILSSIKDLSRNGHNYDRNTADYLRRTVNELVREVDRLRDGSTKSNSYGGLSAKLAVLASKGGQDKKTHGILKSLYFDQMEVRHATIKEAHAHTFEWAYHNPTINLEKWLRSQSGIFWVAGKAGSGKSTFMKFLCNNELTKQYLQEWGGPQEVITASHFFWNAGTTMQKSQEGLLRALLFQVFRALPDLIPTVCRTRWEEAEYTGTFSAWTLTELSRTTRLLSEQEGLQAKFCFFIDGLDEFEASPTNGEYVDLLETIKILASSDSIKICASSRPWNIFDKGFSTNTWKFHMQDLTRDDIKRYATDMLQGNDQFQALQTEDPRSAELITQVCDKAQGVFLWVYFVIKSLLNGLREADDISDLQHRLDSIPGDLNGYFKRMFDSIEEVHLKQTAEILQCALQGRAPFPLIVYSFLDKERKDKDYVMDQEIQPLDHPHVEQINLKMRTRLNARTKDLLELHDDPVDIPILRPRVHFLHRTARDFLRTQEMDDKLRSLSPGFDVHSSLCKALLATTKSIQEPNGIKDCFNSIRKIPYWMIYHARCAEKRSKPIPSKLLDEMGDVVSPYAWRIYEDKNKIESGYHWRERDDQIWWDYVAQTPHVPCFFHFAVLRNLRVYVSQRLDERPDCLHNTTGRPLLDTVICHGIHWHKFYLSGNLEMVRLLLERGADPNQVLVPYVDAPNCSAGNSTVWKHFLGALASRKRWNDRAYEHARSVIQLLLAHGADQQAVFEYALYNDGPHAEGFVLKRMLAADFVAFFHGLTETSKKVPNDPWWEWPQPTNKIMTEMGLKSKWVAVVDERDGTHHTH